MTKTCKSSQVKSASEQLRASGRCGAGKAVSTPDVRRLTQNRRTDVQATTRPPNLPTPRTLPQSLPSTLTVLQAACPSISFILVLGCSLTLSSPPLSSGSSSGFDSPSHLLSIFNALVSTPIFSPPWALADRMSLDCEEGVSARRDPARLPVPLDDDDDDVESASLVKRSEMALSCSSDGSMMCTSGVGPCGSLMLATDAGARTTTGTSCVIVISRS